MESDGSVIVESDSEVEVDVEVEGDSEVIEGDREREPQPGTSGLGVHGGGNGNGTEGATRDMGLKRSAQGLNEGKEVTVGGEKRARLERAYSVDYNMTVWIWAGNYISFTIAAGLIRLHMPGVKKYRV